MKLNIISNLIDKVFNKFLSKLSENEQQFIKRTLYISISISIILSISYYLIRLYIENKRTTEFNLKKLESAKDKESEKKEQFLPIDLSAHKKLVLEQSIEGENKIDH